MIKIYPYIILRPYTGHISNKISKGIGIYIKKGIGIYINLFANP